VNIHIPADFTLAELRAFIEGEAQEAPEGYYTAREWAEGVGVDVSLMRELLKEAKDRGLLQIGSARRESLDGRGYTTPIYALQGQISDSQETIQPEE
jgi:hypothetical protein